MVEQIKDQELGSDLILKLEEIRDLAIGVTWKQYQKADGSYDLIRDCTNQHSDEMDAEKAEQISFAIQSANLLIGAKKVLEIEGKGDDGKLSALLTDQLSKLNSGTSINIKEFNAEVLKLLKDAEISDAKAKLTSAKDFVSMDNRQFHTSTLTKQKDSADKDKLVVESDNILLGITDSQKAQYEKIRDSAQGEVLNIDWYDKLNDFDKKLVKTYAAQIAEGKVMLPTQTREKLAGLRNAYEKSVFVADMDGENMEQVLEVLHTGTPSFHGKGDRLEQTKENLSQLDTFIPGGTEITDNALNSPQIVDGIPNFLNAIDKDAPDLIQQAQKERGTGSCAVTPFNAMRRLASNDNQGFDKNLIKLGAGLAQTQGFENISDYLINGTNKDLALEEIEAINGNKDLKNALINAIEAKSMIINTHSILDSENQNIKLVSSMIVVDFACNNEKGSVKTLFPEINIGKVNIHCASGKDRTGISLTDATNKAVSEKLGLSEDQSRENLKTQIKGGHTQELASLNGGTPGCHGVKSDSKTALSKGNPLNALIEDTAGFNKIKTKKSFGNKAKNLGVNVLKALVVLIALPIIFTGAIVYSAYSGVKKITPYTPNKDDVVSSKKSASQVKIDTPEIDKSVENSRGQDGPHVTKYKQEQQQLGSGKGRGG
ncbi:MAG: hypothetical protein AB8B46_00055 [Candidatus Midichloriaceae bacterium]